MKLSFPNPILIIITLMSLFMTIVLYLQFPKFFTNPPLNNSWVILPIQTGSILTWTTSTWSFTENDYILTLKSITGTVDRIRYILSFWQNWIDYIKQDTQPQNLLLWNTKSSNNTLLHSFLQKYQYSFNIHSGSYLVVITKEPIPSNRDLLIAINWLTLWVFNKSIDGKYFLSDLVKDENDNIYIFPINNIKLVQDNNKKLINLLNYWENINLSLAVWQNLNSLLSIAVINPFNK